MKTFAVIVCRISIWWHYIVVIVVDVRVIVCADVKKRHIV